MPFRKIFVVALISLLALATFPAFAQDGDGLSAEQQALLETVATAQQNFLNVNSYRMFGTQTTTQDIVSGVGIRAVEINQMLEQTLNAEAVRSENGYNSFQTLNQVITQDITGQGSPSEFFMDMEFVIVDGEFYLRFTRVPRDIEAEVQAVFPEDWITLEDASDLAGLDALNLETLTETATSAVPTYEWNADNVLDIEEIDAEPVGDVEVRAFSLTINTQTALADSVQAMLNLEGIDADTIGQMLDSAVVNVTVYVGVEDSLIYRVDSQISLDFAAEAGTLGPDAITLDQTTESSFNFSDFNEDITITTPDLTVGDEAEGEAAGDSES